MYTIIAPTNFSEDSIHAVNYAADLALNLQANLTLLHVVQMPVSFDVPLTQYEFETILQEAEEELALLKKDIEIRTEDEVVISTRAVFSTMENELVELAEKRKPFIIVVGPERENIAERFFLGSNTLSVIKKLRYPVIVVPKNGVFKPIKRIGLATDLNNIDAISVEPIRTLMEVFNASLDIIHVCKTAAEEATAQERLALLKAKLDEFSPDVHIILNESVEEGLKEYAQWHHEDMMVMIPRAHRFADALVHKSNTKQVARNTSLPLLAIS